MGGFGGSDRVVNASDLVKLVANGDLRYILYDGNSGGGPGGGVPGGGGNSDLDISTFIKNSCKAVNGIEQSSGQRPGMMGDGGSTLYQCSV